MIKIKGLGQQILGEETLLKNEKQQVNHLLNFMHNESLVKKSIDNETDWIIYQYQSYVEAATKTSVRRDELSRFYIVVITALITASSAILATKYSYLVIIPLLIAFSLSFIWKSHLQEYRKLIKIKYNIIKKMEEKLPFRGFQAEEKMETYFKYSGVSVFELALPVIIQIATLLAIIILIVFILFHIW